MRDNLCLLAAHLAPLSGSFGGRPGDRNHQDFPKSIAIQMGGAYCDTNGRRTAIQMGGVLPVFPFPQSVGALKVLQYKLEVYSGP